MYLIPCDDLISPPFRRKRYYYNTTIMTWDFIRIVPLTVTKIC